MIEDVALSSAFDEIVICGPGATPQIRRVLEKLKLQKDLDLVTHPWVTDEELAAMIGPNTVALIPHVVSDYTLSQDLMKAYKYVLLGMRVICPRMLWPGALSDEHTFLTDFGTVASRDLLDWVQSTAPPTPSHRETMAAAHSWRARAEDLAGRLGWS